MRRMKKILAVLMAISTIIALFSVPVLAEDGETTVITKAVTRETSISEVKKVESGETAIAEVKEVETGGAVIAEAETEEEEETEQLKLLAENTTNERISGDYGSNLAWELTEDGTLTLSGSGAMCNFDSASALLESPIRDYRDEIKNVIIEDGITSIGDYAFSKCTNLTMITIPDSVTSIGVRAFEECSSLVEITIPDSVTNIGTFAFCVCSSLREITLPTGITSIEQGVFLGCSSLAGINIPSGVTGIGKSAFYGCTNLSEVVLPDSVTTIAQSAFNECSGLTEIHIPSGVTSIGNLAFSDCTSLTEVNIPSGVTSISDGAFWGCRSLTGINIPSGVTSIGARAFYECGSLTGIVIPGSVTSIEYDAFNSCVSLPDVTIPSSVTSIGGGTFADCSSLTTVYFNGDAPEFGTERGMSFFEELSPLESFTNVISNVYYPNDNATWTADNMLDYGGTLTWMVRNLAEDLYIIEERTDNIYVIGSANGAIITCSGEFEEFVSAAMDGNVIDPSYYTVVKGSTVLTLMSEYLDTLAVGEHVVTLNYTYGSVDTILTVIDQENNDNNSGTSTTDASETNVSDNTNKAFDSMKTKSVPTGDKSAVMLLIFVVLVSGCGCLMLGLKRKSNFK